MIGRFRGMEPSPDLHFAAMALDSAASARRVSLASGLSTKEVLMTSCECAIYKRIADARQCGKGDGWRVDEVVSVPGAAHGYVDPLTGKQVGSFMTYIISVFGVQSVARRVYAK